MDTHGVSKYTEYYLFSKITEYMLLKIYVLIIDLDTAFKKIVLVNLGTENTLVASLLFLF